VFFIVLILLILGDKFIGRIPFRGLYTPTDPLSWKEIFSNFFHYIKGSLMLTLLFSFIYYQTEKAEEKSKEKARKKIEERERMEIKGKETKDNQVDQINNKETSKSS